MGESLPYIPLARNSARPLEWGGLMKAKNFGAVLTVCAVAALAAPGAEAKGCVRGAVAGGIAGHAVHHGVIGAVAGCVAARHYYKNKAKQEQEQQQLQPQPQQAAPTPAPAQ